MNVEMKINMLNNEPGRVRVVVKTLSRFSHKVETSNTKYTGLPMEAGRVLETVSAVGQQPPLESQNIPGKER